MFSRQRSVFRRGVVVVDLYLGVNRAFPLWATPRTIKRIIPPGHKKHDPMIAIRPKPSADLRGKAILSARATVREVSPFLSKRNAPCAVVDDVVFGRSTVIRRIDDRRGEIGIVEIAHGDLQHRTERIGGLYYVTHFRGENRC